MSGPAPWHRRGGEAGWPSALPAARPGRPVVGLACSEDVRRRYVDPVDVERLEEVAELRFQAFDVASGLARPLPRHPAAETALASFASGLDILVVCHGSPFVSAEVVAAAPRLSLLGELEGDRFGHHFDTAAAAARGVRIVDTTHGSSWPTAEWALGLALVGLRNAGAFFRRLVAHEHAFPPGLNERAGPGYERAELSHKRVGMLGFGHLARHLTRLLGPFEVDVVAYDPYAPASSPRPTGSSSARSRLSSGPTSCSASCRSRRAPRGCSERGSSRSCGRVASSSTSPAGGVVDSAALVDRLARGDVIACLDVVDPEPLPLDSPLRDMENVFLSPHLGGWNEESRRRFFALMVDECLRHVAGLEPWDELTAAIVDLRNRPAGSSSP